MYTCRQFPFITSLLLLVFFGLAGVQGDDSSWWNDAWQYRLVTQVVPKQRRGGINTARINLREQTQYCTNEGSDVRVVDEQGETVPYRVETKYNELIVFFKVAAITQKYYIYYGNSEASGQEHEWTENLGGLTLETFKLEDQLYRAKKLPELLDTAPESYGKKSWSQINDLENPFGDNDNYISLYTGTVYCPEPGHYTFAVNADDMALFRLYKEGELILELWRNAGVPSEDWKDAEHENALKSTEDKLKPGIYRLEYFHGENGGAQLAKLGWEKPTSREIVTVPPRAFVRYLPVEVQGRQQVDEKINPFFVANHRHTLIVNDGKGMFPLYHFEDRSGIDDTNAASYDWSFGNNQQATGQSVSHEFPGIKPHDVTLTVTAPNGEKASVTRRIYPPSEPATRMTIHMDAQFENEMPILQAGRTAHLKLFVKNTSSLPHDVVFKNLIARDTDDTSPEVVDKQKIEQLEPASDGPEGWHIIRTSFALPTDNVYSQLKLLMHNRPIVEKEVAVMSTDGPLGALQVDQSGTLRDAKNRLVLLRLSCTKSRETPPQEIYHPRTGLVRLLVIDDQLAGPADPDNQNDYIAKLIEQLNSEYPALEFVAVRPTMNLPDESSTISHFLETRRKTLESNANIVIITSQPETVLNNVPKDAFQSYLIATLDQIGSQTSAARMLVTPPPLPGLPELSSEYASIVKQVGIKMGITVGDVYSRLRLTPNWKKLFRQDASQHPSYQIHLNNNGQELVAREIFNSLIRKFGDRFSAAEEAFRQRN